MIEHLRQRLAPAGVTLDVTPYSIHCDAPVGYIWRATGLPSLTIHYATNSQTWLAKELRAAEPELKMGLLKVIDPAELKEHQWNLGEDNWQAPADAPNRIDIS